MIRVCATDPALAAALGIDAGAGEIVIEREHGRLQLRDTRPGAPGPVWADFQSVAAENRRSAGKGLLLARAVGVRRGASLRVLDATAGLGRDAYTLAALGCEVVACERSPIFAALLLDAAARADGDPALTRLHVQVGDTREVMRDSGFDVVYLDPMFPARRKSALVKKEMQYMQAVLGDDNGVELFGPALRCATRRVVVKRPVHAPRLAETPAPTHMLKGKTVRFDVYVGKQISS
jgi:16S rRNA (guanine1516-N2)-methyltransferase